jgi:hypothetical protein
MVHDSDYSVIVFFHDTNTKKWRFVHKLDEFASEVLDNKHPSWMYMNVYDRRTRILLKQIRKGDQIPSFL